MKNRVIREFLLIIIFLAAITFSAISNFGFMSYVIKSIITVILFSLIYSDIKINKINLKVYTGTKGFSFLLAIVSFLLFYPLITLSYSHNAWFGFIKWLYLLISTVPIIFAFYYLMITLNKARYKIFILTIIISGSILVPLILILRPFDYGSVYQAGLFRWSHVTIGRFIGIIFLVLLFLLLNTKNVIEKGFLSGGLVVFAYGLYFAGSRSSITGIVAIIGLLVFYYFLTRKAYSKNLIYLFGALALAMLLIVIFPSDVKNKYLAMTSMETLEQNQPVKDRMHSYKLSSERIMEYPVLGMGFGGYNTADTLFYKDSVVNATDSLKLQPLVMKYPHNLLLESWVELGIPGILFMLFFLYMIFANTYKVSFELAMFFFFGLWMAMFSKDYTSNALLYIGIVFMIKDIREKSLQVLNSEEYETD